MNKTPFPLSVLVLTIALCTALSLTACDPAPDNNGNKDGPQQNRTGTVALDRGLGTITVQVMGMTTQAEWNDIANKIIGRLNTRITEDVAQWGEQETIDGWTPFFNRGIVYIVETNPVGYNDFKTIGDGKTAYIAFNKVDTTFVNDTLDMLIDKRVYPYTPLYPYPSATITQGTPNGLAFAGSVTIKSDDTYTPAAWDAVVANVITAFNAAYDGGGNAAKSQFATVFGNNAGAEIVLVNNLDNNWEVRDGEFKTLYLKTGSIDTANYRLAIQNMGGVAPGVGNATPPQRGAFLAISIKPLNCVILTHLTQNRANLLTKEA